MRTPISQSHFTYICVAGLASALLFVFAMMLPPGGLFAAMLPLLLVGLSVGAGGAALACATACATLIIAAGPMDTILYALLLALPCYFFIRQTLWWRGNPSHKTWYPMLRVLSELTIFAAGYVMMVAISSQSYGGLEALVKHGVADMLHSGDAETAKTIQQALDEWGFAFFAGMAWSWILMLYAFAHIAKALLHRKGLELRPSLAIEPHCLPGWLLALVAICGLAILFGQGADRYTAQAILVVLLLPYLLCGIAWAHLFSIRRQLYFRRVWITCFYVALVLGKWPLLVVICAGLYTQLAEMLDRVKKMG